jgi:hypothetical protein
MANKLHVDKSTGESTHYIAVKSAGLRDALRFDLLLHDKVCRCLEGRDVVGLESVMMWLGGHGPHVAW